MTKIDERYRHDPAFHAAVDVIFSLISAENDLTPLDIRDAAYLARFKYERLNPSPIAFSKEYSDLFEGINKLPVTL